MGKVLKADASAADAYVEIDLGAPQTDCWVSYRVRFSAAALAVWQAAFTGGPVLHTLSYAGPGEIDFLQIDAGGWETDLGTGSTTPAADAWTLIEEGDFNDGVTDGAIEVYTDGTLTISGFLATDTQILRLGLELTRAGADPDPDSVAYFDEVKIGTTRGASDLFADDFEGGDLLAWTSTVGDVSVIDDPFAPAVLEGRVLIALDDDALAEDPTWTRIDDTPNLVSGIDIRRGRQSEADQTETSTATVYLNDTTGDFDMHNTLSSYWGKLVGHQILLQLRNPVTDVWEPQTRMTIDDLTHDFNPATNAAGEPLVANVALECVDLFDYLAGVEMIPGLFGDMPPTGSERTVFYEDTTGGDGMQTRLVQLATDAGIPPARTRFFTGNIDLQETKYDAGESVLVAMRDTVDAEFPDIANLYTDRRGILAGHGRLARFIPETVAATTDWDFRRWKAGDGTAILADSDLAQIRPPLAWARPRSRIVNAAMCTPKGIVDADVPGQIVSSGSSITAYGYRSWSALGLIVKQGATTGFTAKGECKSFARFKVDNYEDPHTRVEAITFKSLRPDDPRAAATWDLLCAVDISDVIELTHGYPGGVGMTDEPFYVEGMATQIRPLNPDFDMVEKTINVSPASAYPPGYVFSDT